MLLLRIKKTGIENKGDFIQAANSLTLWWIIDGLCYWI